MALCYRYISAERCVNCGWNMCRGVQRLAMKKQLLSSFSNYRVGELPAPERDLITSWMPAVEDLDQLPVCVDCEDLLRSLAESPQPVERRVGHQYVCVACGDTIHPRKGTRSRPIDLSNLTPMDDIVFREYLKLPYCQDNREKRVCMPCQMKARVDLKRLQPREENLMEIPDDNSATKTLESDADMEIPEECQQTSEMIVDGYSKVRGKKEICVACDKMAVRRLNLPTRQQLLLRRKLYVSTSVRVCEEHRQEKKWPDMREPPSTFTASEIADMVFLSKLIRPVNFGDVENLDPFILKRWLGKTHEEFQQFLEQNSFLAMQEGGKFAMVVYLASVHTGECTTVLASVCQRPRGALEAALKLARHYIQAK